MNTLPVSEYSILVALDEMRSKGELVRKIFESKEIDTINIHTNNPWNEYIKHEWWLIKNDPTEATVDSNYDENEHDYQLIEFVLYESYHRTMRCVKQFSKSDGLLTNLGIYKCHLCGSESDGNAQCTCEL
jgi:hypothetical protein